MPFETLDLRTSTRIETIDITSLVRAVVRKAGVDSGLVCIFCPHTTAGLTIQENSDPKVRGDLNDQLAQLVPVRSQAAPGADNNSDAHIKSSLVGASMTLIVEQGKPVLGTWQAIYFCEFDGPRSRRVHVKIVG